MTVLLVSVFSPMSVAPARAVESVSPTLDNAVREAGARAYADHFDVSLDEALKRGDLQGAVLPSLIEVETALADGYGGAWFDEDDHGRLKVAVVGGDTELGTARRQRAEDVLRARGVLDKVDFVGAKWSLERLRAEQAELDAATRELSRSGIETKVDVRTNSLVIRYWSSFTDDERERVAVAVRQLDVSVRQEVRTGKLVHPTTTSCVVPHCDRPFRGGVFIKDEYGTQGSAAFNATSRSDGKRYVMTAGHDIALGSRWYAKIVPWGSLHEVGPLHNKCFPLCDSAIIRNKTPSYWQNAPFPANHVLIDGIPPHTAENWWYPIVEDTHVVPGTQVCTTGGGGDAMFWNISYTWCGVVLNVWQTIYYDGWLEVRNLIETNMCIHSGMSGGPTFNWNLSMGINSGSNCYYGLGYFYPIIMAEHEMNVDVVH